MYTKKSKKNIKLLFHVGGSYVSGNEIVALTVIKNLKKRGHNVHCLLSGWNDGDFISRLKKMGVNYSELKLGFMSKNILNIKYFKWTIDAIVNLPMAWYKFKKTYNRFDPDVFVSHTVRGAAMVYPFLEGHKTVHYVQGAPGQTFFDKKIINGSDRSGKLYLAPSRHIKSKICEMGVPEAQTAVIYNGVEVPSEVSELPQSSGAVPTIGIVGQIGEWKGHDDLVEALRILRENDQDVRCVIVGRGEDDYETALRAKIERYGLSDLVEWRGFVEDTDEIYHGIDICAVPSRFSEPFGLVAAEAGARGIPVVATRRGGLPEIVEPGETGYLVEAEAPEGLADRLGDLVQHPQRRVAMGQAARARVRRHFSTEQMVDELEKQLVQLA